MIIILSNSAQDLPVLYSAIPFLYKNCRMGLSENPFAAFGLDKVPQSSDNALINALLDLYPSTNPFRYVPGLPLMPYDTSLSSIIETYDAGGEIVYFNYFSYPFVLELPFPT